MCSTFAYCGIATKIRAMKAKLLTSEDFDKITNMKSVPDVISFLKTKPAYTACLEGMDESLYHRGALEKLLYQSLYNDYLRLFRFCNLEQKNFLKLYLKRYEMGLISYCLRLVFDRHDSTFNLTYKREFFDHYTTLPIDALVASTTIDELLENLKGTDYYLPLSCIRNSDSATLYDYDLALDLHYFTYVWKNKGKILKRKDLSLYTRDCGTKIDLLNLQWIYRAKKYYQMNAPDIYNLVIPIHYKIPKEFFRELVEAPSVKDFVMLAEKTYYAKHVDLTKETSIETMYNDCLHRLYVSDARKNPYSIAAVTTYFFLKEREIDHLTTALECVRYGLSSKEIWDYLGGMKK